MATSIRGEKEFPVLSPETPPKDGYAKHSLRNGSTSSTSADVAIQTTPADVGMASLMTQTGMSAATRAMWGTAGSNQTSETKVASAKDKTPMCLVNELARFNKVAHTYLLMDEQGPAHKKQFHVKLDLGTESYEAWGASIKQAQHTAAQQALYNTSYKQPVPRSQHNQQTFSPNRESGTGATMTPTVELNCLAMKMGVKVQYSNINSSCAPPMPFMYTHDFSRLFAAHAIMPSPFAQRMVQRCHVSLRIGDREFRGEGSSQQHARHAAASKALKVFKALQVPDAVLPNECNPQMRLETNNSAEADNVETQNKSISPPPIVTKSEISQVHEIALRLNLNIAFDITQESGPPHLRSFQTRCRCGSFVSEGEGNSKQISKKMAAKLMLDHLRKTCPEAAAPCNQQKVVPSKKKNRNLIKIQKANPEYGTGVNPISRLIQIQQAIKRKEPLYTLIQETGQPRRREFVIQVECNDKVCLGRGPNKKLAKRNAAEAMLQELGYSKPAPAPSKSALKVKSDKGGDGDDHKHVDNHKHVTFVDTEQASVKPHKQVPGVLVRTHAASNGCSPAVSYDASLIATIAKELIDTGQSPAGQTLNTTVHHPQEPMVSASLKLQYLADLLGFKVEFTDFPKGVNTKQCLTLVALQTKPAQVYHGSAPTTEESHDKASLLALTALAAAGNTKSEQTSCKESSTAPNKETHHQKQLNISHLDQSRVQENPFTVHHDPNIDHTMYNSTTGNTTHIEGRPDLICHPGSRVHILDHSTFPKNMDQESRTSEKNKSHCSFHEMFMKDEASSPYVHNADVQLAAYTPKEEMRISIPKEEPT